MHTKCAYLTVTLLGAKIPANIIEWICFSALDLKRFWLRVNKSDHNEFSKIMTKLGYFNWVCKRSVASIPIHFFHPMTYDVKIIIQLFCKQDNVKFLTAMAVKLSLPHTAPRQFMIMVALLFLKEEDKNSVLSCLIYIFSAFSAAGKWRLFLANLIGKLGLLGYKQYNFYHVFMY